MQAVQSAARELLPDLILRGAFSYFFTAKFVLGSSPASSLAFAVATHIPKEQGTSYLAGKFSLGISPQTAVAFSLMAKVTDFVFLKIISDKSPFYPSIYAITQLARVALLRGLGKPLQICLAYDGISVLSQIASSAVSAIRKIRKLKIIDSKIQPSFTPFMSSFIKECFFSAITARLCCHYLSLDWRRVVPLVVLCPLVLLITRCLASKFPLRRSDFYENFFAVMGNSLFFTSSHMLGNSPLATVTYTGISSFSNLVTMVLRNYKLFN